MTEAVIRIDDRFRHGATSALDATWRAVVLFVILTGLAKFFVDEWNFVRGTWAIQFGLLVILCGIVYAAISLLKKAQVDGLRGTIEHLNERLRVRDEQIGELKEKVGTESPDAIKARIDQLEANVAALSPRRIGEEGVRQLAAGLRGAPGVVEIALDAAAPEARTLSRELIAAFSQAGWKVATPTVLGPGNPPACGLAVTVGNPRALTPLQHAIVGALNRLDVEFELRQGDMRSPLPHGIPPDALILVTHHI